MFVYFVDWSSPFFRSGGKGSRLFGGEREFEERRFEGKEKRKREEEVEEGKDTKNVLLVNIIRLPDARATREQNPSSGGI